MSTLSDVREWAETKGMDVGKRGRLGKNVIEAYNKANPRKKYGADSEPVEDKPARPVHDAMPIHVTRRREGNREIVTLIFEVDAA